MSLNFFNFFGSDLRLLSCPGTVKNQKTIFQSVKRSRWPTFKNTIRSRKKSRMSLNFFNFFGSDLRLLSCPGTVKNQKTIFQSVKRSRWPTFKNTIRSRKKSRMSLNFFNFFGSDFRLESHAFLKNLQFPNFNQSRDHCSALLSILSDGEFVCACLLIFSIFSETLLSLFSTQTGWSHFRVVFSR